MTTTPTTAQRSLIVVREGDATHLTDLKRLKSMLEPLDDNRRTILEDRPTLSSEPKAVKLHFAMAELKNIVGCDIRTDADLGQLDGYETMVIGKRCIDKIVHFFEPNNTASDVVEDFATKSWNRTKLICAHIMANYQIDIAQANIMRIFMPSPATPLFAKLINSNSWLKDGVISLNLLELDQIWGDLPISAKLRIGHPDDGPDFSQSGASLPRIHIDPLYHDFDIPFDPLDTMKMISDLQEIRKS